MTNRTTKELLKDVDKFLPRGGMGGSTTTPEMIGLINELSDRLKEGEWRKGEPDIDATVLMQHELGAGENYDVACYRGRDKQGNDIYMMSNGTEIFKHNVITWKPITPTEEDDAN